MSQGEMGRIAAVLAQAAADLRKDALLLPEERRRPVPDLAYAAIVNVTTALVPYLAE